jgi:hypothetical protein
MSYWFRVYDDLVDDPKVQQLDPPLFKALINFWCLASANDGVLPSIDVIAFKLRMKPEKAQRVLDQLRAAGLVDDDEKGARPHNWDQRQFKSDVSTVRVKRFRERRGNVSTAFSETVPETEAEAEAERRNPCHGNTNSKDAAPARANGRSVPT